MATTQVWIACHYRKLFCPHCHNISIEDLELFHPYLRVTTRLALYIHQLCRFMTVTEVALHVGLDWNRIIDKIRNSEFRKAAEENKAIFKGAKYLLLKNRKNIRCKKEREQLKQLLQINEVINTVLILKDQLKHIWSYRSRTWANKAFDHWCALAKSLKHSALNSFVKMLDRYRYGIINHCDYPINTSKLEGINNKIKVIKRKAYGYHDLRYFTLKIYQAFYN